MHLPFFVTHSCTHFTVAPQKKSEHVSKERRTILLIRQLRVIRPCFRLDELYRPSSKPAEFSYRPKPSEFSEVFVRPAGMQHASAISEPGVMDGAALGNSR